MISGRSDNPSLDQKISAWDNECQYYAQWINEAKKQPLTSAAMDMINAHVQTYKDAGLFIVVEPKPYTGKLA